MKFEFRNEYFRRTKLVLKSQLNGRKKIIMLNNWTVSIMRFGGEIRRIRIRMEVSGIRINLRKCTERPERFLQRIKKSTQDVILQVVFLQKKRWKRIYQIRKSVEEEKNGLLWYVKNNIETLLVAIRTIKTLIHEDTADVKEFKKNKK